MAGKITFSQLCATVAQACGATQKDTEDFLRELFSMVATSLAEGETVKLKGLGTFKQQKVGERKSVNVSTGKEMIIPGHFKISFVPSKELSALVNQDFQAFQAVELADDISEQDLNEEDTLQELTPANENITPPSPTAAETIPEVRDEDEPQSGHIINEDAEIEHDINSVDATVQETDGGEVFFEKIEIPSATQEEKEVLDNPAELREKRMTSDVILTDEEPKARFDVETEASAEPERPAVATAMLSDDSYTNGMKTPANKLSRGFIMGLLAGLAAAACIFIVLLFCYPSIYETLRGQNSNITSVKPKIQSQSPAIEQPATETLSEQREVVEDATPTVVTEPSDADTRNASEAKAESPVYDTITRTRYLTTMAKEHYGNYHLWPYIYEENKKILGHPDRIKPGTQVVIPKLEKYGVDPKNPADISEARKKGVAIYARYNGKRAKG